MSDLPGKTREEIADIARSARGIHRDENRKEKEMEKSWEEQSRRIEESVRLRDEAFRAQAESSRAHAVAMSAFACEICGKGGTPTRLYGGRQITLCNAHKNSWHDFLVDGEAWQRKLEAEARYVATAYSGEEERAIPCLEALDVIMLECYELSGEWLKEEKIKWQK